MRFQSSLLLWDITNINSIGKYFIYVASEKEASADIVVGNPFQAQNRRNGKADVCEVVYVSLYQVPCRTRYEPFLAAINPKMPSHQRSLFAQSHQPSTFTKDTS